MVVRTRRDHARALGQLLPPGVVLPREPGTVMGRLLEGLAGEPETLNNRTGDLIEEADPRTTVEMVDDWERVLGLPSTCGTPPGTLEGRRAAIIGRLVTNTNSSRAALEALGEAMGQTVRITERSPFQLGLSAFGDGSEFGADATRYLWTIHFEDREVLGFELGVAELGVTPFAWIEEPEGVICALAELSPAHTEFGVAYDIEGAATELFLCIASAGGLDWLLPIGPLGLEIRGGGNGSSTGVEGDGEGLDLLLTEGTLPVGRGNGNAWTVVLNPNGSRWLLPIGRHGGGQYQVDAAHDRVPLNGGASKLLNIPPVNGGIPVRMATGEILHANLKEL